MKHLMLVQLLAQHIVNGVQPVLSGMEQPVGHGLPGQLHAHAFKLLLQSVQWRVHHIFLGGNMGNGRRGCKAPWQHRGFSGCALHNRLAGLLLTVLAGIGVFDCIQRRTIGWEGLSRFLYWGVEYIANRRQNL